jgi:hypothetical protein
MRGRWACPPFTAKTFDSKDGGHGAKSAFAHPTLARQLTGKVMSQADLKNELNAAAVEPLLPIEKKLIGWSLGLGIGLLIALIAINHFFPIRI